MSGLQKKPIKSKDDLKIYPPKGGIKYNNNNTVGYDILGGPYNHTGIIATTMSGKTNLLGNIIPRIIGKESRIHLFSHTSEGDEIWEDLAKRMEKREIPVIRYDSMADLPTLIQTLRQELLAKKAQEAEEEALKELAEQQRQRKKKWVEQISDSPDDLVRIKIKQEKPEKKPHYPREIIVFDDISREMFFNPHFAETLKESRHYKACVFCSVQNPGDISPQARIQLKNIFLFKGLGPDKLDQVYKSISLWVPQKKFEEIYRQATEKPYSFLYIDLVKQEFRECLENKIII
jgi:hypothetical protein